MDSVFVVIRNGRRAEPKNHLTADSAKLSARNLIQGLSSFGGKNSIKVMQTKFPHKIR